MRRLSRAGVFDECFGAGRECPRGVTEWVQDSSLNQGSAALKTSFNALSTHQGTCRLVQYFGAMAFAEWHIPALNVHAFFEQRQCTKRGSYGNVDDLGAQFADDAMPIWWSYTKKEVHSTYQSKKCTDEEIWAHS